MDKVKEKLSNVKDSASAKMSQQQDYKFEGWQGHDPGSVKGNMKWGEYQPKPFEDNDVDIQITHCGVCGSDLHMLRSGWMPAPYPVVVGHEIVGKAVRVGSQVKDIKVGDRVGVGAQSSSCKQSDCEACGQGMDQHCQIAGVDTYADNYPDGSKSWGGYANYSRVPDHFVFKIPDGLSSEEAAPMLCGGITVYAPLVENGAGPGKKVGIAGLGGLGHFGVVFAKALGCSEIVVISRTSAKKADAMKMGATKFIATGEDKDWAQQNAGSLDLIVSTISSNQLALGEMLSMLRLKGTFIQVGVPEEPLPSIPAFALIGSRVKLGGSKTGSPAQIREMLDLAARQGVHSWTNPWPMKDANGVLSEFEDGKARYRFVLVN